MNRPIVLGVAALLLFALGVIAANTHVARGVIFPVTAYEADVNKDAHVNVADLGLVASKYGKPVPTMTPTMAPTATPTPSGYQTYQVSRRLDQNAQSQSGFRYDDMYCSGSDEAVGWTSDQSGFPVDASFPVHVPLGGIERHGWRFNYAPNGGAFPPVATISCLSATSSPLPISHKVVSNYASIVPFAVPCDPGSVALGWGASNDGVNGTPTPLNGPGGVTGWQWGGGYKTYYGVCIGASEAYIAPQTYIAGVCDVGDAMTMWVLGGVVCLDNPPQH